VLIFGIRPEHISNEPKEGASLGSVLCSQDFHAVIVNADYWEKKTALIRGGAVRVLSLFTREEVDYWRDQLKLNRRASREIALITWATNGARLRSWIMAAN
jgi:hypothetical protein